MSNTNPTTNEKHVENMKADTSARARESAAQLKAVLTETAEEITTAEAENTQAAAELTAAQRSGDFVRIAKAKARVAEAEERYRKARFHMPEQAADRVKAIRRDIEKTLSKGRLADPESVDMATVELLKSGVMTAADLQNLAENAIAKGNHTMARLIAAEAERKYTEAKESAEKAAYLHVSATVQNTGTSQKLQAVDIIGDVIQRGCRTPAMFSAANELTEKAFAILQE